MSTRSEELARILPTTMRSLVRLVAVEMERSGSVLSIPQFGVLDFLLSNSQAVQTDLAHHLLKDKSVVLRMLDDMETAGWVERQMDPHDRRRKNLVVTAAGKAAHGQAAKLRNQVFTLALETVSEAELATCVKVMNAMHDHATTGDPQ